MYKFICFILYWFLYALLKILHLSLSVLDFLVMKSLYFLFERYHFKFMTCSATLVYQTIWTELFILAL